MQSSYWGYWLVVFGVAIVGLMISVNGITTNSTQDYYSVKEMVEASMLESVDYAYYRDYNEVKINKEKFMEVFIRMAADNMGASDTYEISFYDIYEAPPKVSVELKSHSGTSFISSTDYDLTTRIDSVIQVHAISKNSTKLAITNGSLFKDMKRGEGKMLQLANAKGTCTYESSNTKIATVNNGYVRIVGDETGSTVITVNCGGEVATLGITSIYKPSLKIENGENLNGKYEGETVQLRAVNIPEGSSCSWKSDVDGVATVDNNGNVTIGSLVNVYTTITVKCGDESASIDMIRSSASVVINNKNAVESLMVGHSITLDITKNPSSATCTYKSSNDSIATVDSSGNVKKLRAGTAEITVTCSTATDRVILNSTGLSGNLHLSSEEVSVYYDASLNPGPNHACYYIYVTKYVNNFSFEYTDSDGNTYTNCHVSNSMCKYNTNKWSSISSGTPFNCNNLNVDDFNTHFINNEVGVDTNVGCEADIVCLGGN